MDFPINKLYRAKVLTQNLKEACVLTDSEIMVLHLIFCHCEEVKAYSGSERRISEALSLSKLTVHKAISRLISFGFIRKEKRLTQD